MLTFTGGGADVVQQIHDEVQVHKLIIKAVVVEFEQLLLLGAQLCTTTLHQCGLIQAAHLSQRTAQRQEGSSELTRCPTQSSVYKPATAFRFRLLYLLQVD